MTTERFEVAMRAWIERCKIQYNSDPDYSEVARKGFELGVEWASHSSRLNRMRNEHADLRTKIDKLREFIRSDGIKHVASEERVRLHRQEAHMNAYADILGERIAYCDGDLPDESNGAPAETGEVETISVDGIVYKLAPDTAGCDGCAFAKDRHGCSAAYSAAKETLAKVCGIHGHIYVRADEVKP